MQRVVRACAGDGSVSFPLHAPDDSAFGNLDASLRQAVHGHLSASARSGYDTAGRAYARFCEIRGTDPFPVTARNLGRFMIWKARYISIASLLGVYLSGVRDAHENEGYVWRLDRSPQIRKVARYLKKLYGVRSPLGKAAVTVGRLERMARHIPGWPDQAAMTHDDRLFLCAAVHGTLGFLRGGEFGTGSKSGRHVLKHADVSVERRAGLLATVIQVRAPKARWWEESDTVVVFPPGGDCPFDPAALLREYRARCPLKLRPNGPAFVMSDGRPLSKAFMIRRAQELMDLANIRVYDKKGTLLRVRASSFRAGGVQSGQDALVPPMVLKALGRWSSSAWMCYASDANELDLRGAIESMWRYRTTVPLPVDGAVSPSVAPPADLERHYEIDDTDEDLTAVTDLRKCKAGSSFYTKWGKTTVVNVHEDGELECTTPGFAGSYFLNVYDGEADDLTLPEITDIN